jgi:hypothetical protein
VNARTEDGWTPLRGAGTRSLRLHGETHGSVRRLLPQRGGWEQGEEGRARGRCHPAPWGLSSAPMKATTTATTAHHPLVIALLLSFTAFAAAGASAAPRGAAGRSPAALAPADTPSLASRWWEARRPCPAGSALRRDAPAKGAPDQCPQPFCEVWCARPDGQRHGPVTGWYRDSGGRKHHEGTFRDGEKDGRWVAWYLDGGPADDGAWTMGLQDSLWQQWWEGGERYRTMEFRRGEVLALTPYRDGKALPTEHAAVEGKGLAEPHPLVAPEVGAPAAQPPRERTSRDYLEALLAEFPEAYRELSEVTYEYVEEGPFIIAAVRVLAPAAAMARVSEEERKARACRVKQRLGFDCACEAVEVGPATDYAWHSWSDKRVVPVTLRFLLAC